MYTPMEAIENTVLDILSWDGEVTYENLINLLNEYINNLKRSIGIEAHKKLVTYGIKDETGMTWEEQDKQAVEMINDYKNAIKRLQKRDLNLNEIEKNMTEWALSH